LDGGLPVGETQSAKAYPIVVEKMKERIIMRNVGDIFV
jgi:hypothetical protein